MTASSWQKFYETARQGAAHNTTVTALRLFNEEGAPPGFCVDIGCGEGLDAMAAIVNGWTVLAIEKEQSALEVLYKNVQAASSVNADYLSRLKMFCGSVEQLDWPANQFTNASLSLPFCPKPDFAEVWQRIVKNIVQGGRFAGHFFGDRDGWAPAGRLVHMSRNQIESLFDDFELELFEEDERDFNDIDGRMKHWHIFHVVAKKL
jgi:tellurite methyltransferase